MAAMQTDIRHIDQIGYHGFMRRRRRRSNTRHQMFVTLAMESPARDHDGESAYDSFNGRETDECRDTSDTESSDCPEIDPIEYELASTSETEDSVVSSDGTEDYQRVSCADINLPSTSISSDDVPKHTDIEDVDGSTDMELGRADYWTCVKCKNPQNNPLYRYCERCYQIRKTQFPPRPRTKRKRIIPKLIYPRKLRPRDSSMSSSSSSSSSSSAETGISSDYDTDGSNAVKNVGSKTSHYIKEKLLSKIDDVAQTSKLKSKKPLDFDLPLAYSESSAEVAIQKLSSEVPVNSLRSESSQEIICSAYGEIEETIINGLIHTDTINLSKYDDSIVTSTISSQCSNLSEASTSSEGSTSSGVSSMSSSSSGSRMSPDEMDELRPNKRKSKSDQLIEPKRIKKSDVVYAENPLDACMICLIYPKNGGFAHGGLMHLCCCYTCAVKVWSRRKMCPICNCKARNVFKVFSH